MTDDEPIFQNEDAKHIWREVKRIADALESFRPEPEEATESTCPHPPETRISLGTTKGQEEWICGICKWRTPIA